MSNKDLSYMGESPLSDGEDYFNPDVYQAVNQLVDEIDGYDRYINNELIRRTNNVSNMITRLENQPPLFQEENRPVPLQPPFDCNNPINYHKCCTVFCDSLSPWYDAVQCMNRCSGAATPSQPSLDMCCVILKLDNPLQCAQITKVCGGNCPGECTVINNNGQPPYYMVDRKSVV